MEYIKTKNYITFSISLSISNIYKTIYNKTTVKNCVIGLKSIFRKHYNHRIMNKQNNQTLF